MAGVHHDTGLHPVLAYNALSGLEDMAGVHHDTGLHPVLAYNALSGL